MRKLFLYVHSFLFVLAFWAIPGFCGQTSAVMELKNLSCNEYAFDARKSESAEKSPEYSWDFGDGTSSKEPSGIHPYKKSGTYRVTLTVGGAEKSSTSQQIEVNVPPRAEFTAPSFSCTGEKLELDASASKIVEGAEPVYKWDFGDGETSTGKKVEYRYKKGGSYKLTLSVDDGKKSDCSVSKKTVDIKVNEAPTAMLNKVAPVCTGRKGKKISFDASSSISPQGRKLTYHWDFGDGTTAENRSKVRHHFKKPGTYKVTVSVDDGSGTPCSVNKDKIYVKINTPPNIVPGAMPENVHAGTPAVFDGSQSSDPDGDGLSFYWSFGEGKPSSQAKTTHTYKKKGKYKVVFFVDDNSGTTCSGKWEKFKIRVGEPLPAPEPAPAPSAPAKK